MSITRLLCWHMAVLVFFATVAVLLNSPWSVHAHADILDVEALEECLNVWWGLPDADVTGYRLQWKSGGQDFASADTEGRELVIKDASVIEKTVTGLIQGRTYSFRLVATRDNGDTTLLRSS